MGLTMTRPEKAKEMADLIYALREASGNAALHGDLNIAEVVNSLGQAFASVLVGAYAQKEREIVLSMLPDLIRASFSEWEKIYSDYRRSKD